jgi:hypothetical protein
VQSIFHERDVVNAREQQPAEKILARLNGSPGVEGDAAVLSRGLQIEESAHKKQPMRVMEEGRFPTEPFF